jgi:hypothetical protein
MFYICTKYGDQYHVNDKGEIIRLDQKDFKPSGSWLLLGLRHTTCTQSFVPFDKIKHWLTSKPELLFKNGNPQWAIEDLDYGIRRTWGNTEYHGIASICFID